MVVCNFIATGMADVNNDVLVLGACIMDFIWLVLSFIVALKHYNHPRCHTHHLLITRIVFSFFLLVMLIICRKLAKQLKERNLRLDMEVMYKCLCLYRFCSREYFFHPLNVLKPVNLPFAERSELIYFTVDVLAYLKSVSVKQNKKKNVYSNQIAFGRVYSQTFKFTYYMDEELSHYLGISYNRFKEQIIISCIHPLYTSNISDLKQI